MSQFHTGNVVPEITKEEHQGAINAKRVYSVDSFGAGGNGSLVLTYTSGDLTKITKTIDGTSYERTFGYTDGNVTTVSAWSKV